MGSLAMLALLASGAEDGSHATLPGHPLHLAASAGVGAVQGTRSDHLLCLVCGQHLHAAHPPHLPVGAGPAPAQLHATQHAETHHPVSGDMRIAFILSQRTLPPQVYACACDSCVGDEWVLMSLVNEKLVASKLCYMFCFAPCTSLASASPVTMQHSLDSSRLLHR